MKRILYVMPQISFNLMGGAEIQAIKTLEYINKNNQDYEVKLFNMWKDKIENFDAIHLFGPGSFPSESQSIAQHGKRKNIKIFTSPIFYLSTQEFFGYKNRILMRALWNAYLNLHRGMRIIGPMRFWDQFRSMEEILRMSDCILPNTKAESDFLMNFFNLKPERFKIIPNGVDTSFKYGNASYFEERYGIEDFILFV